MTLFSPCPYYMRARRRLFQTLISNDLWYEKWCDHVHDVTSTGQRKLWVPDRNWTYNPLFVSDFYKCTVEPRRHEGPRDWQNLLAIPMFRYIEVLFDIIILLLLGWRNFVIPRTWLYRGSLYRGSTLLVRFESIGQFWRSSCWYDPWWC